MSDVSEDIKIVLFLGPIDAVHEDELNDTYMTAVGQIMNDLQAKN